VATGRLRQRSYETKEGEKRTSIELEIDDIGPSLRYATAQVQRQSSGARTGGAVEDSWSAPAAGGATQDPWANAAPAEAAPIEDAPF
jgi:single-strand DNA-binding protein